MPDELITINGKNYLLVDNTYPRLGVGYATNIYQDPMTRTDLEEIGVIRKILRIDDEHIRADIEFDGEREFFQRTICRF